jgi:molecular chaperone DnaJ
MNKRDYYEILGISKTSTKKDIKSAYRKLAKEYHPDRNKAADAETKFKEIQEAYEILYDDQKRKAYDQYGHAGTQGFAGGGNGFGGFSSNGFDFDMGGINDIFEQFFGGGFGGFSSNSNRPSRGQDISSGIKITFQEAVFGTEKILKYKRNVVCESCSGSGAKAGTSVSTCNTCGGQGKVRQVQQTILGNIQTVVTCPNCQGAGQIIKDKCNTCTGSGINQRNDEFKVKIPQGIPDSVTLKFSEKGNAGSKGGKYGDLYIDIEVETHEKLERRGDDIYTDSEIDVITAVLGGEIDVETVNGTDTLSIPAGIQPETILKMSAKGGPKFRGGGNGDQYVRIMVKIPTKINSTEKEYWNKLKEEMSNKSKGFMGKIFG